MSERITKALKELQEAFKEAANYNVTSVNVFFNAYELNVEITERTAEQLSNKGISMRNINGEFINKQQVDDTTMRGE